VSWLDVVGWTGSALLVWSLLQPRVMRLRVLNLLGSVVLIGYNGALRSWPMVGLNLVLAVINIGFLWRLLATRHDDTAYSVVEVDTHDQYLAHFLRVHAADIARFNPDFRGATVGGPDRCAFLVARGDETVGVVVARQAGDGTAQVELDYVTRRFRDFTPAEFVYRRSHLFADRGFRRVIGPPGMAVAYYDRLGFRHEGDSYVLDVPERVR
jgi:hypothetical protein